MRANPPRLPPHLHKLVEERAGERRFPTLLNQSFMRQPGSFYGVRRLALLLTRIFLG
jgi:hypothetical protein